MKILSTGKNFVNIFKSNYYQIVVLDGIHTTNDLFEKFKKTITNFENEF